MVYLAWESMVVVGGLVSVGDVYCFRETKRCCEVFYSIREDDRSLVGEGKRRGNMCVFCVRLEMADRACSRIRNEEVMS